MEQAIPVYVISLGRSIERREAIVRHLNSLGIQFEVVEAVDGATLNDDQVTTMTCETSKNLHRGTIGCYMSHISVYEKIASKKQPLALILEDDARLSPKAVQLLTAGIDSPDFDYCFLDSDDHNDRVAIYYDPSMGKQTNNGFTYYRLSDGPQTLHAYLITRDAASKRLEHAYPIRKPVDLYDHLPYPIRFAAIINPKLAWVSEQSLVSFTSTKHTNINDLSFAFIRRWSLFYTIRDLVRLRAWRNYCKTKRLIRSGALPAGKPWKALPSGREIVIDR